MLKQLLYQHEAKETQYKTISDGQLTIKIPRKGELTIGEKIKVGNLFKRSEAMSQIDLAIESVVIFLNSRLDIPSATLLEAAKAGSESLIFDQSDLFSPGDWIDIRGDVYQIGEVEKANVTLFRPLDSFAPKGSKIRGFIHRDELIEEISSQMLTELYRFYESELNEGNYSYLVEAKGEIAEKLLRPFVEKEKKCLVRLGSSFYVFESRSSIPESIEESVSKGKENGDLDCYIECSDNRDSSENPRDAQKKK